MRTKKEKWEVEREREEPEKGSSVEGGQRWRVNGGEASGEWS